MQTSDSIVIIPTYNEKENIENIIRAVFGLEKCFHILIIEDNSPDGTADIVRRLQTEFPERLFMIERKGQNRQMQLTRIKGGRGNGIADTEVFSGSGT